MSAVSPTNATITAAGLVIYEYEGIVRALLGSVIPAGSIDGLITSAQIEEIAAAKITGTITETQIAPEAISTPKLKAGAVVTAKLAAGAVTAEKIAVAELSAITANLGTVTAGIIQGPTIRTGTTGARVVLSSAGLSAFNAGGTEVLAFSTATGNLSITGAIKAGSTVPATTITGQLTDSQLAEIAAAKITGTIGETQIAPEAISTPKLKAGAVVTAKLAAAAVTAEKIAVGELSAITANLGTITAGTITGALFRSSATNPQVGFDATGFWSKDETGTKVITVTAEGSLGMTEAAEGVIKEYNAVSWSGRERIYGQQASASLSNLVLEAGFSGTRRGQITAKLRKIAAPSSAWVEKVVARIESGSANVESDFLQLTATANRKVNFGTVQVEWTGTAFMPVTEVKHGLGVEPLAILLTPEKVGSLYVQMVYREVNTERFKADGVANAVPAAGTKSKFAWMAIG